MVNMETTTAEEEMVDSDLWLKSQIMLKQEHLCQPSMPHLFFLSKTNWKSKRSVEQSSKKIHTVITGAVYKKWRQTVGILSLHKMLVSNDLT